MEALAAFRLVGRFYSTSGFIFHFYFAFQQPPSDARVDAKQVAMAAPRLLWRGLVDYQAMLASASAAAVDVSQARAMR